MRKGILPKSSMMGSVLKLKRLRIPFILALAAGLTALIYSMDMTRGQKKVQDGLALQAKQLINQAQSFVLIAKEKGEADPVKWTLSQLQTVLGPKESAIAQMNRFTGTPGFATTDNFYDLQRNVFVSKIILIPESGDGIQFEFKGDYFGFLGSQNRLFNDAMLALTYLVLLIVGFAVFRKKAEVVVSPQQNWPHEDVKIMTLAFTAEAKQLLLHLGVHVREMVREARNLSRAASDSKKSIATVRSKIHADLTAIHSGSKALSESVAAGNQAEVLALNLVIEAARLGEAGKGLGKSAEELHRTIQKMKTLNQKGESVLKNVEVAFEPLATEADVASYSYEKVFESTQGMDSHIKKTTETMMAQAKLLQDVNTKLNGTR